MSKNVAILGVTGAVGQEFITLLEERNFPLNSLKALASKRSAGKKIKFKGEELVVEEVTHDSFSGIDLVLSSAGGKISKEYAPSAVNAGAVVVDNTSYFRMDPDVPLIIPEINPEAVNTHSGIIANPNCSTIIMLLPIAPLLKKFRIKRLLATTYQAASGAGAIAMQELEDETRALLDNKPYTRTIMPHQYAFNLFPHNSPMQENGYVEEEIKMINETRKIFNNENFCISAMCVRVPVLRAHSESLNIEFEEDVSVEAAYEILGDAPGIKILEDREANRWPMPIDASGKDAVFVGRIRKDLSRPNTLDMWVVGDQIRKGAALNAIQIAEAL